MRFSLLLFTLLVFSISNSSLFGQYRDGFIRVGVSAGMTHYQGDLSDYRTAIQNTQAGFGLMGAYHFSPMWSGRLTLFHGWIEGDDALFNNEAQRSRNLNFRSPITEVSAQLVFDFIPNDRSYLNRPKMTPYAFGGIAVFAFNPRTQLDGQWIELQPLGTEGQYLPDPSNLYPDPYNQVQLSIPAGLGLRFALNDLVSLEIEAGLRYTFTDYLDDVSTNYPDIEDLFAQNPTAAILSSRADPSTFPNGSATGVKRGSPSVDDYYAYTNVTLSIILDKVKCPSIR